MKALSVLFLVLLVASPGLAAADNAATTTSTEGALLNIDLKDISVRDAVAKLFEGRAEGYFLESGATGKVAELKLKGVTLEQGLTALADAAGLRYRIEDGVYIIGPKAAVTTASSTTSNTVTMAPATAPAATNSAEQPNPATANANNAAPPAAPQSTTQVVINPQPAPVFYGNPQPDYYGYPPGYGQPYSIGAVDVVPGGWYPIVITGAGPQFIGRSMLPPPPPEWVSPDVLRFLRYRYLLPTRPYAGPGYLGW